MLGYTGFGGGFPDPGGLGNPYWGPSGGAVGALGGLGGLGGFGGLGGLSGRRFGGCHDY